MKILSKCLWFSVVMALSAAACHRVEQAKETDTIKCDRYEQSQCFKIVCDGDTSLLQNSYEIDWPKPKTLTPADEQRLLAHIFGSNAAASFDQSCKNYLNNNWTDEDGNAQAQPIDSIPSNEGYGYQRLTATCRIDSGLASFIVSCESYTESAAHGIYSVHYLNYDQENKRFISLSDLVDTAQLGPVIVRAIEDLAINKEVYDCLYEHTESLPVPDDFIIDSNRSIITVVYQLYDIACYACGIQSVELPVFWLSKHIELTPYAKEFFGPDSHLPDVAEK